MQQSSLRLRMILDSIKTSRCLSLEHLLKQVDYSLCDLMQALIQQEIRITFLWPMLLTTLPGLQRFGPSSTKYVVTMQNAYQNTTTGTNFLSYMQQLKSPFGSCLTWFLLGLHTP